MAITGFPDGTSSFGIPVAPGIYDAVNKYWGGGPVLWVGNRSGLPAGDGSSPAFPLSALFGSTGAIAKLNSVTSQGCIIFVLPGHAENVAGAYLSGTGTTTASGTTNAYAVVGLGIGALRPTFTWSVTTSGSSLTLDTASVVLDNLNFQSTGTLAPTLGIEVKGADCAIRNCRMLLTDAGGTANAFATGLKVSSGANYFKCENSEFLWGGTTSVATNPILINTADSVTFNGVTVISAITTGAAIGMITNTTACTNLKILNSFFANRTASSTVALKFASATTGWLDNCLLEVASGTVVDASQGAVPNPTIAAAINTPGTLNITSRVLVSKAAGKSAVVAAVTS